MTLARTYLDHNATAPLRPEARAAMLSALDRPGNPSSVHAEGRAARFVVEEAREEVAALVGAKPEEVVLTSGATEANATIAAGIDWGSVVFSCIEHPSILNAWPNIQSVLIASDPDGRASVDDDLLAFLHESALPEPSLVGLQLVNGETGVIQDVSRLVETCRRWRTNCVVHTDAVQAAGRVEVDFRALGVDSMSISSHKLGGPQGVGALIVRDGLELQPLLRGGGQERRRRSGTENVAAIAGFGAAAKAARLELKEANHRIGALRARLEAAVLEVTPGAVIVGRSASRVANTTCLALAGARAEMLVIKLDLAGIAVSAGAACSSGKVGPNETLLAMGLPADLASGAIRISLGPTTSMADVDRFIAAWAAINRHGLSRSGSDTAPTAHMTPSDPLGPTAPLALQAGE